MPSKRNQVVENRLSRMTSKPSGEKGKRAEIRGLYSKLAVELGKLDDSIQLVEALYFLEVSMEKAFAAGLDPRPVPPGLRDRSVVNSGVTAPKVETK